MDSDIQPVIQTAPVAQPIQAVPQQPNSITPNPTLPGGPDFTQMSQTPVADQSKQFKDGEQGAQVKPSRWDQWSAGWDLLSSKSPVGLPGSDEGGTIPQYFQSQQQKSISDQNNSPILSAVEANKLYPGRPEPYSQPVSQWVAEMESNNRERIGKIQAWKNSGSETPWTDFGQGLAGGFADPLNAALSLAVGPLTKLAGIGEAATVSGRAAQVFGQNLAINTATGAMSYAQEKSEGNAPSLTEAAKQDVEGAVGGTVFHYGMGAVGSLFKSAHESWFKESPETQAKLVKETIAQMELNNKPALETQNNVIAERQAGSIQEGERIRQNPVIPQPGAPVHAALTADGKPAVFEEGLGKGVQLTENAQRANNAVSNPEGTSRGMVGETSIPESAKVLNIDQPAAADYDNKEGSFLKAVEEKTGVDLGEATDEDISLKDIIKDLDEQAGTNGIPADITDQVQEVAKAQGYSGFEFMEHAEDGTQVGKVTHLFDESTPITGHEQIADPNSTPQVTENQQATLDHQAVSDKSQSQYSDPETDKAVHDLRKGEEVNNSPEYMDPYTQEIHDQAMNELKQLAETSKVAEDALEELRRLSANEAQRSKMAQMLADCVAGGIS